MGCIDEGQLFNAANYLTTCVFKSLGEMFTAAVAIQKWFAETARMIALSGEPVAWITPMGLPVVQPYHRPKKTMAQTALQSISICNDSDPSEIPHPVKQRTAFPPNFIHSLDSTHMMYTANACRAAGVRFVSVHDSFWTHAATVEDMGRINRQQFVRLHSQPLLDNLYHFFRLHYDGRPFYDPRHRKDRFLSLRTVCITPPPPRGSFDVQQVLNSKYFFH